MLPLLFVKETWYDGIGLISVAICVTHYVTYEKTSGLYAVRETIQVFQDNNLIYLSPQFVDNMSFSDEFDVISEEDHVVITFQLETNEYLFIMFLKVSKFGPWRQESQLVVKGEYGNVLLRVHASSSFTQKVRVYCNLWYFRSLIVGYPIRRDESIRHISATEIPSNWIEKDYDDLFWDDYKPLTSLSPCDGSPHYFRRVFTISHFFSAYEIDLFFRYGLVVYVNGLEIIRENMAIGSITPLSPATGGYTTEMYHGYIRSGDELVLGTNILAVELHFLSQEYLASFAVWLAGYISDDNDFCFTYPYPVTVLSQEPEENLQRIVDFNTNSVFQKDTSDSVISSVLQSDIRNISSQDMVQDLYQQRTSITEITLTFPNYIIPALSSFSLYVPQSKAQMPTSVRFYGTREHPFVANDFLGSGREYGSIHNGYVKFPLTMFQSIYHKYRLELDYQYSMQIVELHLYTCSYRQTPHFMFDSNPLSLVQYTQIDALYPSYTVFTSCTSQGTLPQGMAVTSDCAIIGVPLTAGIYEVLIMAQYPYDASYSLSIEVSECTGEHVTVRRTSGVGRGIGETVQLWTQINNETVVVYEETGEEQREEITTYSLCLIEDRYSLSMGSKQFNYWQESSMISLIRHIHSSEILIYQGRYDLLVGAPHNVVLHFTYPIQSNETWFYHVGSIPSDQLWINGTLVGSWSTGRYDSFGTSPNQIQLYSRSFIVSQDDINDSSALLFHLFLQYGCVVYVNGVEVYRWGIEDLVLNNNTLALVSKSETGYLTFTVPLYSGTRKQTVHEGENTLVIALIGYNAQPSRCLFDCSMVWLDLSAVQRSMAVTPTLSGFTNYANVFENSHFNRLVSEGCFNKTITIEQVDGSAEYVNLLVLTEMQTTISRPRSILIYGKPFGSSKEEMIETISTLNWQKGQQSIGVWLLTSLSFRSIRIVFPDSLQRIDSRCNWQLDSIRLECVGVDVSDYPLSYEQSSVYEEENVVLWPEYPLFTHYQIQEQTSLTVNYITGIISGNITKETIPLTITAVRYDGEIVVVSLEITPVKCPSSTHSLVHITVNPGEDIRNANWMLYYGSQVFYESHTLPMSFTDILITICVPTQSYSLQFSSRIPSNPQWMSSCSYQIELYGEVIMFGPCTPISPPIHLPQYIPSDLLEFRFCGINILIGTWTSPSYDDSVWPYGSFSDVELILTYPTTLVRHHLDIPLTSSTVIVQFDIICEGGVAIYYDDVLQYSYNLPDQWDFYSYALESHDPSNVLHVTVRLLYSGHSTTSVVIPLEHHISRDRKQGKPLVFSYSIWIFTEKTLPFSFDIDTVETMSGLADINGGFIDITERPTEELTDTSEGLTTAIQSIFAPTYSTFVSFHLSQDTSIRWTVKDTQPLQFSEFGMLTSQVSNITLYLYGCSNSTQRRDECIEIMVHPNISLETGTIFWYSTSVALLGFQSFLLVIDGSYASTPTLQIHSLLYSFSIPTGIPYCPSLSPYEAVQAGEISVTPCLSTDLNGYMFRRCLMTGIFDQEDQSKCNYRPLRTVRYTVPSVMIKNIAIGVIEPSIDGHATFRVIPSLPNGIVLDYDNGMIWGTPKVVANLTTYSVYASNSVSAILTTISFAVRYAQCTNDGIWENVTIDNTPVRVTLSCNGSNQIGIMSRVCVIGSRDGEWDKVEMHCYNPSYLILYITLLVLIISSVLAPYMCYFDNPLFLQHRYDPDKVPGIDEVMSSGRYQKRRKQVKTRRMMPKHKRVIQLPGSGRFKVI